MTHRLINANRERQGSEKINSLTEAGKPVSAVMLGESDSQQTNPLQCGMMPRGQTQEMHVGLVGVYQKESNVTKIKPEDERGFIMRVISASQRHRLAGNTKMATVAAQYVPNYCNFICFISSLCFSPVWKKALGDVRPNSFKGFLMLREDLHTETQSQQTGRHQRSSSW